MNNFKYFYIQYVSFRDLALICLGLEPTIIPISIFLRFTVVCVTGLWPSIYDSWFCVFIYNGARISGSEHPCGARVGLPSDRLSSKRVMYNQDFPMVEGTHTEILENKIYLIETK